MKITTTGSTVKNRAGSIVILVSLLIPLVIALVAFAVDYGVIIVARQELQNAADAAATATLQTLNSDHDSADLAAFETLTANLLLGSPIDFDMERDVHYGSWDADSQTFTPIQRAQSVSGPSDVSGASIPDGANAVRIRLTRSRALGNGIQLFFAPVIGTNFAEIEVEAIAAGTPGCSGFVGLDFVNAHNNIRTDSYNSELGDYDASSSWIWDYSDTSANRGQNGDVCSNGPIDVKQGAIINGDASGTPVSVAPYGQGTVTGNVGTTSSPRTFDPVDFNEANINDNDTVPKPQKHSWPPYFITPDNDLIVSNGRDVTLDSGVYRFRNLRVGGGSTLTIDGEVTIYVERELRFDNGTTVNPGHIPADFKMLVGEGPVNIQGRNQLHGVIYAPNAAVSVGNDGQVFGSIIGKSLDLQGGAHLHFDESLADEEDTGGSPKLVY